jgi:hypothetical protein
VGWAPLLPFPVSECIAAPASHWSRLNRSGELAGQVGRSPGHTGKLRGKKASGPQARSRAVRAASRVFLAELGRVRIRGDRGRSSSLENCWEASDFWKQARLPPEVIRSSPGTSETSTSNPRRSTCGVQCVTLCDPHL